MKLIQIPSINQILMALKPSVCGHHLIRLGDNGDGGYLCPDDLEGVVACISPGASNIKTFEDHLWCRYGIPSLIIDATSTEDGFTTLMLDGQILIKKWLSPVNASDSISLADALRHPMVKPQGDLLLQMDIEGAEYLNLASLNKSLLERFRIIIIEFHSLSVLNSPWRRQALAIRMALGLLRSTHTCVHLHPNNCCGEFRLVGTPLRLPNVIECTFLRNDRIHGKLGEGFPGLPHHLDSPNVHGKHDISLDPMWNKSDQAFLACLRRSKIQRLFHVLMGEIRSFARKLYRKSLSSAGFR